MYDSPLTWCPRRTNSAVIAVPPIPVWPMTATFIAHPPIVVADAESTGIPTGYLLVYEPGDLLLSCIARLFCLAAVLPLEEPSRMRAELPI